jgi:Autophagy protein Apg5
MSDAQNSNLTVATIQCRNWDGSIPIQLSLASTSVSSPTIPPPIHTLVSRNTYLHVGLRAAVQRLQSFALIISPNVQQGTTMLHATEPDPSIQSLKEVDGLHSSVAHQSPSDADSNLMNQSNNSNNNNVTYPVCWFEDEETKMALRWQYFVGVLYDMHKNASVAIPWKIKLHFTNYPSLQILTIEYPHDILYNVQVFYKHSLKQAMAVISGNSKSAMNVTKESHGLLWDAITNGNYSSYQRVDLKITSSKQLSPIQAIPIRVLMNTTSPPIQRRIDGNQISLSLGQLLQEWLPEHFVVAPSEAIGTAVLTTTTTTIIPNNDTVQYWNVCGIQPPLSTNILDLWWNCSHPDYFLYVVLRTRL